MITLHFPIAAVPHQSVRVKSGFFYQPAKIKQYKKDIVLLTLAQLPDNFEIYNSTIPLRVDVSYLFKYRKTEKKANIGILLPRVTKPDLTDNLNKATFDALAGVVFEQDQQIYEFNARKFWYYEDSIRIIIKQYGEI